MAIVLIGISTAAIIAACSIEGLYLKTLTCMFYIDVYIVELVAEYRF